MSCPSCLRAFNSLHALAAHCEAEGKKCNFSYSEMYGIFLQQLTWNLVEVAGEHKEDGTKKYAITREAKEEYGSSRMGKTNVFSRKQQAQGFNRPCPRIEQRNPFTDHHHHPRVANVRDGGQRSMLSSSPKKISHKNYSGGTRLLASPSRIQSRVEERLAQGDYVDGRRFQPSGSQLRLPHREQHQARKQQELDVLESSPLTGATLSWFQSQQDMYARTQLCNKWPSDRQAWDHDSTAWDIGNRSSQHDGW